MARGWGGDIARRCVSVSRRLVTHRVNVGPGDEEKRPNANAGEWRPWLRVLTADYIQLDDGQCRHTDTAAYETRTEVHKVEEGDLIRGRGQRRGGRASQARWWSRWLKGVASSVWPSKRVPAQSQAGGSVS